MLSFLVRDDFGEVCLGHLRWTLVLVVELQGDTAEYRGDSLGMLQRSGDKLTEE